MAGNVSISEAPTTGLGKLIHENTFFVPTHQRDYRWELEKAQRLFDDLTEAMERGDRFYFVGLMVFMRSDAGLRVLDGQQRLATTIMILSAIRSWLGANKSDGTTAQDIQRDFIGRADYGDSEMVPKLSLNYNNSERFQRYVVRNSPLSEVRGEFKALSKHAPNYRMLDAIIFCHTRISEIADRHADTQKTFVYLTSLVKYIRDAIFVVRLTVPNEANAFRVFETLNDRGLDLSAVDLLKNHLFGLAFEKSPGLLAQMERRWVQITQVLHNVKEEEFLRAYWVSRNGRIQLEDIFEDVQKRYKTGADASDLSIELLEASEQYAAFDSRDDPVWHPYSEAARDAIATLKLLGSKQVRPVILSALKSFTKDREVERLLRLMEVVIVRWQIIGEERTGILEIQCARLAHQIAKKEVTTATGALESMGSLYLSDKDFRDKFATKDGVTRQTATYLLTHLEAHVREKTEGAGARELAPAKSLTLEHIFPQNPMNNWTDEILADPNLSDEVWRLGNLCLLTEPRNRKAASASFGEKRPAYEKSTLYTTSELANLSGWNREEINKRQERLASYAPAIWRFQ